MSSELYPRTPTPPPRTNSPTKRMAPPANVDVLAEGPTADDPALKPSDDDVDGVRKGDETKVPSEKAKKIGKEKVSWKCYNLH